MPDVGFLSLADIFGWLGNIGFIIGAVALMRKKPITCQVFNIIGNILYIGVGVLTNTPSLLVLSFALGIINYIGVKAWRKSMEKKSQSNSSTMT